LGVGCEPYAGWNEQALQVDSRLLCLSHPSTFCYRLSYRWNVIVGDYLQTSSTEELFTTLFKAVAGRSTNLWCAEFLAILQELSLILPAHEQSQPSSLLSVLQGILCTVRYLFPSLALVCCDTHVVTARLAVAPWLLTL
jgi:hypothetical protein